jgi:hypothetical protein
MARDIAAQSVIYEPPEAGFPFVGIVMVGGETMACCATETRQEAERTLAALHREVEGAPEQLDS